MNRAGMAWLASIALPVALAAVADPPAHAASRETVVTLDFDIAGQEPPSKLCVLADYMTEGSAIRTKLSELDAKLAEEGASVPTASEEKMAVCGAQKAGGDPACKMGVEHGAMPEELMRQCVPGTGKGGLAVVYFANTEVVGVPTLTEGVARLTIGESPKSQRAPVQAELVGGHYWADTPVPVPVMEGAQLVRMTLRPRCFRRTVTLPDVQGGCSQAAWSDGQSAVHSEHSSGSTYTLCLHNAEHGTSVLTATCDPNQIFQAEWSGGNLPDDVQLQTSRYWFDWHMNCLSGKQCPVATGDVHCAPGQPVADSENKDVCRYVCGGSAHFPANVRFSFGKDVESGEIWWTDTLSEPGQELTSFVPASERRVRLNWSWNEDVSNAHAPEQKRTDARTDRSNRAADAISYVQIRTPGGQIHNVLPTAQQIRIPELDCGDSISYRYEGDRLFREVPAPVKPVDATLGQVVLPDPSASRTDRIGIAVAFGSGGRWIGGGGSAAWGPYGQAEVVLVIRYLRDIAPFRSNSVGVDLDLRGGAIFLGQPYCSDVATSGSAPGCAWERVSFWQIPFTLGPNLLFASNMTLGGGLGVTFQSFHLSSDSPKVSRPALFTAVTHVGYRLTHAVTVEAQAEFLGGEDVRQRTFDEAGVLEDVQAPGSGPAVLLGGLIRVDDLF